jgi:hypothetical protein
VQKYSAVSVHKFRSVPREGAAQKHIKTIYLKKTCAFVWTRVVVEGVQSNTKVAFLHVKSGHLATLLLATVGVDG